MLNSDCNSKDDDVIIYSILPLLIFSLSYKKFNFLRPNIYRYLFSMKEEEINNSRQQIYDFLSVKRLKEALDEFVTPGATDGQE